MMEDPKRKAMDAITQKQIDEARIALGILDRMAQRCQAGDAAACATLQTNWNTLSQQLHKTLAIVSGSSMQAQPGIPTDDPAAAMPAPTSPSPSYVPPMNSPTDDQMPGHGENHSDGPARRGWLIPDVTSQCEIQLGII